MTTNWIKPTIYLFLALLGLSMGLANTLAVEPDWHAIPDFFFGAMFFVHFLSTVPERQQENDDA